MPTKQRQIVFFASCMALITTAMSFAIRGGIISTVEAEFGLTKEQSGWILNAWAWGFAGSILFGGPLCDVLKMGRVMYLAFIAHVGGFLIFIFSANFAMLFIGTLIGGMGNGLVEAAVNPLVATLYPKEKVAKLNLLHAWFPGGIVIGALVAFALDQVGFNGILIGGEALKAWQCKMGILVIPAIVYAVLFAGKKLPETERVASGVSTGDMWKQAFRPAFIMIAVAMMFTGATELGPGSWITAITEKSIAGMATAGILVLAFINLVMCVGRFFAGPVAHKLSPPGIIALFSVIAAVGLVLMSRATTAAMAFPAAGLFGVGVCFFWPTMLAMTSERFPKGGALALGVMGAMGNVGAGLAAPVMGAVMDKAKAGLGSMDPKAAEALAMPQALQTMVVLPIIVAIAFGAIVLWDRSKGGYKAVQLGAAKPAKPGKAKSKAKGK
jgi:fucose permease